MVNKTVIEIERGFISTGGGIDVLEPLRVGDVFPGIYPHNGPGGVFHKGNMRIDSISDIYFDDSGKSGYWAMAKCVQRRCNVGVRVIAVGHKSCSNKT